MVDRALADLISLVHLAFIVFVVFGGLLALRRWWFALLHLPAVLWSVFIEASGGLCPLTPLENHFRQLSGSRGYAGGFIEHYLLPLIYPAALTREVQFLLVLLVLLINVVVYGLVLRHRAGQSRRPAA